MNSQLLVTGYRSGYIVRVRKRKIAMVTVKISGNDCGTMNSRLKPRS